MSSSRPTRNEVESILLSIQEGLSSPEDIDWLNAELRDDSDLRRRVSRFLVHESLLEEAMECGAAIQARIADASRCDPVRSLAPSLAPGQKRGRLSDRLRYVNRRGLFASALAATVLVALCVQNAFLMRRIERLHAIALLDDSDAVSDPSLNDEEQSGADLPSQDTQVTRVVGRVIGVDQVQWEDGVDTIAFGDQIKVGRKFSLTTGIVELLLSTGAKVTIEGPAQFVASAPGSCELSSGKIAAAVPRSARGYTVLTPTSEVVDIGTHFGIAVADSGDTEVHVFDGDVVARSRLEGPDAEFVHAREDEAFLFATQRTKPDRIKARLADFVRRIGPAFSADELPDLPVTDDLGLWYAAEVTPGIGNGDRIATWHDLLIGDNKFADDAWQFDSRRCPNLVVDERGRRAIRFDGWSTYLATSPMETSEQQTCFVVYSPGPANFANEYHGGILLKYPSSPSLEVAAFADHSARGWVWPGVGSKENVGVVRSQATDSPGVFVVAYTYDAVNDRAELWVNGTSQGHSSAPVKFDQPGRRFIGSHPDERLEAGFFGNVYEILVYDDALSEESMGELDAYFQGRYALANGL